MLKLLTHKSRILLEDRWIHEDGGGEEMVVML